MLVLKVAVIKFLAASNIPAMDQNFEESESQNGWKGPLKIMGWGRLSLEQVAQSLPVQLEHFQDFQE